MAEDDELTQLSEELDELGLVYESRDPGYRAYLQALHRRNIRVMDELQALPLEEQEALIDEILDEIYVEQR